MQLLGTFEPADVVDLVEDHKREDLADAGYGAEPVQGVGVMILRCTEDEVLELPQHHVVVGNESEIDVDVLLHGEITEASRCLASVGWVRELLLENRQVVLAVGILDVGQEFGAFTREVESSSEQVTGSAHLVRVDVCLREHATAQYYGDLVSVDAIVFGFAAVDGFHVEGVAEYEVDSFAAVAIGEPVPGGDALDGDYWIFTVIGDSFEKGGRVGAEVFVQQNLASLIEDAKIHGASMEVDAAIMPVLLGVESHRGLLVEGSMGPGAYLSSKLPGEAFMSIKRMNLPCATGAVDMSAGRRCK